MSLLEKYKRLGVTDSAYELYKEEITSINKQYGLDEREKESAYKQALKRLEDNSLIKKFDMRTNKGFTKSYKTYARHHQGATLQDYIDEIEGLNEFYRNSESLSFLDSEQIREIYQLGKTLNMTKDEVFRSVNRTYLNHLSTGDSIDNLFNSIIEELQGDSEIDDERL